MADEEETTSSSATASEEPPAPETRPEPTEADRLRDENARLREDIDASRREPERIERRPATVTEEPDWSTPGLVESTHAEIDRKWQAGEIDDARRSAAYATLATRVENFMDKRRAAAMEAAERTIGKANDRLQRLIRSHPELKKRGSPLLARVQEELDDLATLGYDPTDVRTQVLAAEKVVAARAQGEDDREYDRRRRPVGGGGGGTPSHEERASKGKSRGELIYARLTGDAQEFYRTYHGGDLPAIYKTLNHADESLLQRKGRFR